MTALTNGTIQSMVCRARPTPCDATVAGTVNGNPATVVLVTNDSRMIAMLSGALIDGRQVDLSYGDPLEYYWDDSLAPPAWRTGNLLEAVTLT